VENKKYRVILIGFWWLYFVTSSQNKRHKAFISSEDCRGDGTASPQGLNAKRKTWQSKVEVSFFFSIH